MTDNEKIKVLEDFIKHKSDGYQTYLAYGGKRDEAQENFLELMESFIEMFNRQKAEIERLRDVVEKTDNAYYQKVDEVRIAKANAIKEFAELIKQNHGALFNTIYSRRFGEIIDNLAKEMVGDDNG